MVVKKEDDGLKAGAKPKLEPIVVDQTYHGFLCKFSEYYPEFNMTAYVLQHERMRTEYLHIDRKDPNNVFSVNFRTPPQDSSGLPHILEHIVLCGSQRYPVRDPFFKMLNRSLATFMNAMTGPDYTIYPFSSTNERDFRNLQKVYLDAVFCPNLRHMDFLQEGWRLEQNDLNDPNSEMSFKGVVFNEMKGAFATNDMIMNYGIMNNLLPDHTYGHVSGGWPLAIVNLTWEELVAFHKEHYHPSNAQIYSYGTFDVRKSLQYVNEEYLSKFEPLKNMWFCSVPSQRRWKRPRESCITGRFDSFGAPIEKQCQIAIGYMMCDVIEPFETFLLNVISELLVTGPNSPFYKTLIQPNVIGGSFGQMTGYNPQLKDTIFVVALQNINQKDFSLVEKLIDETIDNVIAEGFDAEHVQSVVNKIELTIKHQSEQFGLQLLVSFTPAWNHGAYVPEVLNMAKHLKELKGYLLDKDFLKREVRELFKDNKHRLVVKMIPNENYEAEIQDAEKQLLNEKVKKLGADDRQKIQKTAQELLKEQQAPAHNTHLLPCLSMNDISKEIEELNTQHIIKNNIRAQLTLLDTNNIVYLQGICFADHLGDDEKLLLPLLTHILPKMGTRTYSYFQFDKMINMKTAGIGFGLHFAPNISEVNQHELGIQFWSYCLEENAGDMFDLFKELLLNFELHDVQRFSVLLQEYMAALSADIAQTGHVYSIKSASGLVMKGSKLKAELCGLEHIYLMKKLCASHGADEILAKLQKMAGHLFGKCSMKYALNMTERSRTNVMKKFDTFTADLSSCIDKTIHPTTPKWINGGQILGEKGIIPCVHNVVDLPVNYCGKSILAVPYTNKAYPPLRVLDKLLTSKYLLPTVREQNGAYGAGARIDVDGLFSFYSYRDPYNRKTLDAFDESLNWLNNNWDSIDDQAIFEAKLGVLQSLDAPVAAGYKGLNEFTLGITPSMFKSQRNRVIATSKDKLMQVAQKYLKTTVAEQNTAGKAVLGPADDSLSRDNERWRVNDSRKVE